MDSSMHHLHAVIYICCWTAAIVLSIVGSVFTFGVAGVLVLVWLHKYRQEWTAHHAAPRSP